MLQNAVEVDVEQVRRVKRTTLGLGVELGAENGTRLVDHTLVALVVQVDKVGLPLRRQGGGINSVTVVLAGNVAAASAEVQSGNVVGTVTVLELDGAGASGESQQLVTQADTEDGDLGSLHKTLQVVDSVLAVSRVTGTVGDEDTVEVVSDLVDGEVEGEDSDASTAANQAPQDVLLNTTVDDSDVGSGISSADVERLLGADLTDQVDLLGVGESLILVGIVLLTNSDTGKGGTLLTQEGDNGTSVDARDSGDALTSTPLAQALNSSPVAVLLSNIGNNNTSGLEVGGLEVLQQTIGVLLGGGHTVVTNQRLGEDQDLATVGGIGKGLGVSDKRGSEDSLAGDVGASTERLSSEHGAITDGEGSRLKSSTLANSSHEAGLSRSLHSGESRSPVGHGLEEVHEHFDGLWENEEGIETMGYGQVTSANGRLPKVI